MHVLFEDAALSTSVAEVVSTLEAQALVHQIVCMIVAAEWAAESSMLTSHRKVLIVLL